jgi:branched-chain amino acid transport system substrate-binding protein
MFHAYTKRRAVTAAALTAITVTVTSCADSASEDTAAAPEAGEPWQISFVSDLSGPLSVYGTSELAGLQTWFDKVNAEGGVAGSEIELAVRDDKSDVQAGLATFREALDEEPLVVLGPFVSSLTAAAAPLAQQQKVNTIMWSPVKALLDPPQEYLFAGAVTLDQMALIQLGVIDQLAEGSDDLKIVIGRLDTAAGEDFAKAAKTEIESRGWELVGEEKVATTATDVSDQAAALANSGADFCLCATFGPTNLQLMRGLRSNGSDMIVVNYFGGGFATDMKALDDPDYYAVTNFVDPTVEGIPAADDMRSEAEEFGHEDGMVGYSFTQGYVVGMAVTQALETCGDGCDSDKFREALRSADFDFADLAGSATFGDGPYLVDSGLASHWVDGHLEAVGDWQSVED